MRTNVLAGPCIAIICFFCLPIIGNAQATCATATTLSVSTSCVQPGTQPTLNGASNAAPTGSCGGATSTTTYGVWYKFTATTTTSIVTVGNLGGGLTSIPVYVEVLSGTCGSFTAIACQNSSTPLFVPTTIGTTYYVRVYTTTPVSGNPKAQWYFDICVQTPPTNDDCSGAVALTTNSSCTSILSNINLATPSTGFSAGCASVGTHYDAWYSFVASSTTHFINLTSVAGMSSPEIQLYSGSCGALTSIQCGTTSISASGLTIGNTYFVRVSNVGSSPTASSFNICVTYPPSNDDCSNATVLYSNSTCTTTSATLASATASAGIPLGCAAAGTYYDVWFSFVAANSSETITASGFTGIPTSTAVQLFSGSCGALTSLFCNATTINATGLTVGSTYYIRVSSVTNPATGAANFNICVTHPAPTATTIDYGKSYVNISKNSGGGNISPGDTLEIRATMVIKSGSAGLDSLAFMDTLHLGAGLSLVPGSISLRTNEGKVYKSFTDAVSDDAGYYYTSGTDTVIRINFGTGANATTRGKLLNTSKPSVFGTTCIIMATYRVVVYAGYGSTLSLGGGKLTGSITTPTVNNYSFGPRTAMIYSSPGLCPNAVSATNAIGGDYNGTFGSGTAQNRGPSGNVLGYTYATFAASNPQDYYYGIANNTSPGGAAFTTITTWAKPDASTPSHRVFNLWDITGDHTGASNLTKGNLPCDPSKPQSVTNPCGYMLVVNSAYRTDTAFQYAVTNLCPNTYYEISAWYKNICYKCGCDSNGIASTATGYIPSAPNDSSGVQPNITYDINGTDYYTTGNIPYGGLFPSTQTGSDSNNTWIKRGFTYLTGPGQTSFTLTMRNNAPGGGGNDWAMDDISLATCLPNMQYSPSLTPITCNNNLFQIDDTIRSYFSNYQYYKWQQSIDGGSTWADIAGASGTSTPTWNGSAYQYIATYTIPVAQTNLSNSGDKYRVVVGTTSTSLSNTNCQVTDGVSQISLSVVDCSTPLGTNIISFNANAANKHANLYWTTNRERDQIQFQVERSADGINFVKVGTVRGAHSSNDNNRYSFADTLLPSKSFYRIILADLAGRKIYSRIIQLQTTPEFLVSNVTNYFETSISLDVNVNRNSQVQINLLNTSGHLLKTMTVNAYNGTNNFIVPSLTTLSPGVYILQVANGEKTVTIKAVKK
jgi:trimeric autotransporter adhesin